MREGEGHWIRGSFIYVESDWRKHRRVWERETGRREGQ